MIEDRPEYFQRLDELLDKRHELADLLDRGAQELDGGHAKSIAKRIECLRELAQAEQLLESEYVHHFLPLLITFRNGDRIKLRRETMYFYQTESRWNCQDGTGCEFRLVDGKRIFYRTQANKVTREMVSSDGSQVFSREIYVLNQNQSALLALEDGEALLRMETSVQEDSSRVVPHRTVLVRARLLEYEMQALSPATRGQSTKHDRNAEDDHNE